MALRTPKRPNILITGVPGTGKTSTAQQLAEMVDGLNHINVSELVKAKNLHDGHDAEFDTYILNEDKVCDELEDVMVEGFNVVDFHSCDFFPERWFHLVVVLRTDNSVLYPRLEDRQYSQQKITENVEAEIMQVCLDEARDAFDEKIVWELQSDTIDDMDANVERIAAWLNKLQSN